ncbi:MAG: GIY-YIG nuclease family protein [Dehalococcoidia bacterium]
MTNNSGTLYVGVTNDLVRRVHEHREKLVPGFTAPLPPRQARLPRVHA